MAMILSARTLVQKFLVLITSILLILCVPCSYADRLDELSSYCLGNERGWARMIRNECKIKKRYRHRHRKARFRRVTKVEVIPGVAEIERAILLHKNPFSCFKKLLRGEKFAVDYLPPCFTIYANDEGRAALHPAEGLEERDIPVVNLFDRTPGCYIACYSRNPDKGVFPVADGIYMIGQIRVRGSYNSTLCVPEDYETKDIRGEKTFKEICSKSFSCIGNSCWAGPNTGAWFGLE